MAEHVIITEGSGMNVIAVDAVVNKTTTNDANVNLEPNTFYELGSASLQTLNLPTSDKDGDLIVISSVGSGGFKIVQAAGEQILFGTAETTLGTFGTLESTQINSVIYLRRLLAPGLYLASNPQGDLLIDAAGAAILQNAINDTGGGAGGTNSYGELYKAFEFNIENLTANVWQLWDEGTFISGILSDFSREDSPDPRSRLTYTGLDTKDFLVRMTCTSRERSDPFFEGAIYKNGVRQESSRMLFTQQNDVVTNVHRTAGTSVGFAMVSLSTNDNIEPWVMSPNTEPLGLFGVYLSVTQLTK